MKSNRGITISSLVIYIIGLVLIIGVMGTVTGYFYNNLNEIVIKQDSQEQYSKFLSYLTKDVNAENLIFVQTGVNNQDCIILKFDNGEEHQYLYQNSNIYYLNIANQNEKKIALCSDVSIKSTSAFNYSDGKIDINFYINDEKFSSSLNINQEI